MKLGVSSKGLGTARIKKGLAALGGSDVLVGIPEENGPRKKGDVSNAQLLFIHTNGSPAKGIPPRPVIEPAIAQPDTANAIAKQLSGACVAALNGDSEEMEKRLNRAGQIAESASKKWFTNPANNWAPNAPSTIRAKGSDKPLIDTGALRRSITHVVELGPVESTNGSNQSGGQMKSEMVDSGVVETGEESLSLVGEAAESVAEAAEILVII